MTEKAKAKAVTRLTKKSATRIEDTPFELAPLRDRQPLAWEGSCAIRPWHYKVCAVIPHLDTVEELRIGVELLRLQTARPYILVIDTGSTPQNYSRLEKLRAPDIEVHSIRLNGVKHPSEFVTAAMDLAFSICRSEYMYCTHADVFVRRRDWIEELLSHCTPDRPAAGYEITPRICPQESGIPCNWQGTLGHTATMLHMPTMDRLGIGWSMRRLSVLWGKDCQRIIRGSHGWPDTESLMGYLFQQAGIVPKIVGYEKNNERTLDANIDHCRSLAGSKLYAPDYYKKAKAWAEDAKREAKARAELWRKQC